jgi:HK97 family phage portal protein
MNAPVGRDQALGISTVYRAFQVLTTAGSQLTLKEFSGSNEVTPSALVERPSLLLDLGAFIEYSISSLAGSGDAFWEITRSSSALREPIAVEPLDPAQVGVVLDPVTGIRSYTVRGRPMPTDRIRHLQMMRLTGRARGLGPVEAARIELRGTLDARDYGNSWFSDSAVPNGVLTTADVLSAEQAKQYKDGWNGITADGTKTDQSHEIRVLGSGLSYEHLNLKPADAQFLETQQFNTTQLARLFGIPASLMLAAVQGSSTTYSNVEQDWIGFIRFTLMSYLKEIEDALSSLLPYGRTVRFNVDALLRTDTKTRYEAHQIALNAGFKTVNEVRRSEGLPALPGGDALAAPRAQSQVGA